MIFRAKLDFFGSPLALKNAGNQQSKQRSVRRPPYIAPSHSYKSPSTAYRPTYTNNYQRNKGIQDIYSQNLRGNQYAQQESQYSNAQYETNYYQNDYYGSPQNPQYGYSHQQNDNQHFYSNSQYGTQYNQNPKNEVQFDNYGSYQPPNDQYESSQNENKYSSNHQSDYDYSNLYGSYYPTDQNTPIYFPSTENNNDGYGSPITPPFCTCPDQNISQVTTSTSPPGCEHKAEKEAGFS